MAAADNARIYFSREIEPWTVIVSGSPAADVRVLNSMSAGLDGLSGLNSIIFHKAGPNEIMVTNEPNIRRTGRIL